MFILCLVMGQGTISERAISVGANKRYRVRVCVPEPGYKVYIPLWWEKVVETTSGLAHSLGWQRMDLLRSADFPKRSHSLRPDPVRLSGQDNQIFRTNHVPAWRHGVFQSARRDDCPLSHHRRPVSPGECKAAQGRTSGQHR